MNRRIKELLAEASLFCYDDGTVSLLGEKHVGQYDIEKFAELIVKECVVECTDVALKHQVEETTYAAGKKAGALECVDALQQMLR